MNLFLPRNEQGFILVWSLLLLVVVTLLGAAAISTSIFENQMAANEGLHKMTFYQADGGTENGVALLKHNINCISGFGGSSLDGGIEIDGSLNFWLANNVVTGIDMASDTNRDFYYPRGYAGTEPHTNGRVNGRSQLVTGANLPMLAGYEGKGKALGADGAFLEYEIKVEHIGLRNSRSAVSLTYRVDNQFAANPAGNCVY